MGKYIIEVSDAYAEYICGKGNMLCLPVRINKFEDNWLNTNIPLTPYTEPNTDEAYRRGYETAKHECEDCRKIRADAEQELADKAYQRGLNDAWEAARKIVCLMSDGGFTQDLLDNIFGSHNHQRIMALYSASDAMEKISKYEPEQTQIGDEVESDFGIGMVTKPLEGGAYIMWEDGSSGSHTANEFRLTGRHFPELAEVLQKMEEK